MTERERVEKYLICDGCGYAIDTKKAYTIVTVRIPGEPAVDQHFHSPRDYSDCLSYWYVGRKARERK